MKKTRANYLPLYVRDFWTDPKVQAMTWTEKAVYLQLLMLSWEEGPLPCPDEAADLLGPSAPGAEVVRRVYRLAWKEGPDGWTNPRLERERQHLIDLWGSDVQRERAHRGWVTRRKNADGMPSASNGKPRASRGHAQTYQDQDQVQDQEIKNTPPSPLSGGGLPGIQLPRRASKPRKPTWEGEIPERLRINGFPRLWGEWLAYRREEVRAPVTQRSGDMALRELEAMGVDRAEKAIKHTIAKGWRGIREPEPPRPGTAGRGESIPDDAADRFLRKMGLGQ